VTGTAAAVADAAGARFTVDFRAADGAWQRGPLTSCGGVRFEDALPVRPFRFEKGLRNFAGWWYFATTGDHVGFESWLERPVDRTNPGPEFSGPSGRLLRKVASSAVVFVHGPSQAGPACAVISVVRFVTSWGQT